MNQKQSAWVLTHGLYQTHSAKTAHGLVRGSDRFDITGLIDDTKTAGQDAGMILDGHHRHIPIYASVNEALAKGKKPKYAIVGIANPGGTIPQGLTSIIIELIQQKIHIINGLHEWLRNDETILVESKKQDVELIDVRLTKSPKELHFWTGKIYEVNCPIVAVMGMDTHLGKRTTCRFLQQTCQQHHIKAEMIYTGQTGWMQSGKYGFILDSTLNDFVSGELEHAIYNCFVEENPQVIFVEGQSGLRNPSGPCGAEILISGNAKHTILVYHPKQIHYDHNPKWGRLANIEDEVNLIGMYGSKVIGIALNTSTCTKEESLLFKKDLSTRLELPVVLPIEEGVEELVLKLKTLIH